MVSYFNGLPALPSVTKTEIHVCLVMHHTCIIHVNVLKLYNFQTVEFVHCLSLAYMLILFFLHSCTINYDTQNNKNVPCTYLGHASCVCVCVVFFKKQDHQQVLTPDTICMHCIHISIYLHKHLNCENRKFNMTSLPSKKFPSSIRKLNINEVHILILKKFSRRTLQQ